MWDGVDFKHGDDLTPILSSHRREEFTMASIYKEWYEVGSEKEAVEKEMELRSKGYDLFDIYRFNYQGADGKFHREVFVFNN